MYTINTDTILFKIKYLVSFQSLHILLANSLVSVNKVVKEDTLHFTAFFTKARSIRILGHKHIFTSYIIYSFVTAITAKLCKCRQFRYIGRITECFTF